MDRPQYYIVEFMEDVLSDWSLSEYVQMHKYLARLPKNVLIFSNFGDVLRSADELNVQNLEAFLAHIKKNANQNVWLAPKRLHEYRTPEGLFFGDFLKESGNTAPKELRVPAERVCLLDMRGKEQLSPADDTRFDAFVFGGILGDHPPRDRTSALRSDFLEQRRLTEMQMSTDTAVLVTDIVLNDKLPIAKIPLVYEPELVDPKDAHCTVQMEGFVYVSDKYDVANRMIVDPGIEQPIISPHIRERLMFTDFEFELNDFGF